ncbi:MAG: hypothetical protein HC810_06690 [Acaryochloridaceae cyanobacterium RL_2_7]|nr:hypothetical protein [Acaryochloridaceae cyanobacterium RL_2_7]
MSILISQYQELLATYSDASDALVLLRDYRPYFEKIPSIRRASDSIVPIPLPTVQIRKSGTQSPTGYLDTPFERRPLPCDIAILMCDPDWQIKNGEEIFLFIHRPGEDFSDLLKRWRETQVALGHEYIWDMPMGYEHMLSEGSDKKYPLFVLFDETHPRIVKGLKGARLPYIIQSVKADPLDNSPSPEFVESYAEPASRP